VYARSSSLLAQYRQRDKRCVKDNAPSSREEGKIVPDRSMFKLQAVGDGRFCFLAEGRIIGRMASQRTVPRDPLWREEYLGRAGTKKSGLGEGN